MYDDILKALGLRRMEDLSEEERKTLLTWGKILSTHDVTIDDLKKFLPIELARANRELHDYTNGEKKQTFYQAYASLLEGLTQIITTPATQRDQLRSYLKQRFNLEI